MVNDTITRQMRNDQVTGAYHLIDISVGIRLIIQGRHRRRDSQTVDVIGANHPADPVHDIGMAKGKPDSQAGKASGFRQRPEHEQIGNGAKINRRQDAVSCERLIQLIHHDKRFRRRSRKAQHLIRRQTRSRGVVWIAQHQDARLAQ